MHYICYNCFSLSYDAETLGDLEGLGPGVQCLVQTGQLYAYPMLNSFGTKNYDSLDSTYNDDYIDFSSSYCDCSTMSDIPGAAESCSQMDFMPAWVFFKGDFHYSQIGNFTLWAYRESLMHYRDYVYPAYRAFPSVAMSTYDFEYQIGFNQSSYRFTYDALCVNCSIFAINAYGG